MPRCESAKKFTKTMVREEIYCTPESPAAALLKDAATPLLGDKKSIVIPKIEACRADWINVKIKEDRFKAIDRKIISLH